MQLVKFKLSTVAILAITSSSLLQAENYVSVEYLHYNENDNRVSVQAPSISASVDFGTDYNLKADFVSDAVSGATPTFQPDSGSGASVRNNNGDYSYANQDFSEVRNAWSLLLTTRFENRDELYTGVSYSAESDFYSKTASAEYLHYTDSSHNRAFSAGVGFTSNEILNYGYDTGSGASQKETSQSLNVELGVTQVLNKNSSLKASLFTINDTGYLTNPHANVVRDYTLATQRLVTESRPDKRVAYGSDIKYVNKVTDRLSYHGGYRFYSDDWKISSHTVSSDLYYRLNKAFTFGGGLRYYKQSEASFYNGTKNFFTNEQYASSDERLSAFNALTYKTNVEFTQNKKLSYNLGAEFYKQSTGLSATIFTTGVKYKY